MTLELTVLLPERLSRKVRVIVPNGNRLKIRPVDRLFYDLWYTGITHNNVRALYLNRHRPLEYAATIQGGREYDLADQLLVVDAAVLASVRELVVYHGLHTGGDVVSRQLDDAIHLLLCGCGTGVFCHPRDKDLRQLVRR